MDLSIFIILNLIVFVGFFVKGLIGFADGLIILTLGSFFIDIKILIPIFAILTLGGNIQQLVYFKEKVNKAALVPFLVPVLVGIIIGTYFLVHLDSSYISRAVGIFVTLVSLKILFFNKIVLNNKIIKYGSIPYGAIAGILNGMTGIGGPMVVIFLQSIEKRRMFFRGSLIAVFSIMSFFLFINYVFFGVFTREILLYSFASMFGMIAGTIVGISIFIKIPQKTLEKIIAVTLFIMGIIIIFK